MPTVTTDAMDPIDRQLEELQVLLDYQVERLDSCLHLAQTLTHDAISERSNPRCI